MFADELSVIDADSSLWSTTQPLLDVALQLEQNEDAYSWHGWRKQYIDAFLQRVPARCTLVVGVWETCDSQEQETLIIGCVCEVVQGQISSIRTFESLAGIPAIKDLEAEYEHALEIMRAARTQIAPVAWALFTDKATWNEWLFTDSKSENVVDKSELLTQFALQGRCVLMGSQTKHYHP